MTLATVRWSVIVQPDMTNPLSLTGRRWTQRLASGEHGDIPSLAAALRAHRGMEIGSAKDMYDIQRLPDLAKAIDRVQQAVKNKEKTGIFGDYDCDGITATALLARALRRRGANPHLRLPHRLHEGYGLKMPMIEELSAAGITLLITADTGGSSVAEITEANRRGMDVIVIDHHHLPASGLPPAYALLHPGILTPAVTSPPAAAGVAWSFVEALEEVEGRTDWEDRDTDVALAAMGTVGDLVELRGWNRALVQEGLRALGRVNRGPLALLKMQAGIEGVPRSSDIAFRLAPRINAAGRMADPAVALDALLGNEQAVLQLEEWNRERQTVVLSLTEEAVEKADEEGGMICLADPRYAPGICGLIAGRVTEKFGRPSLVAYVDAQSRCTASLRSVPGYNVTLGLERCQDLLQSYGGHAMAAGCSFAHEHFAELRRRLSDDVENTMDTSALVPSLFFDAELRPSFLSLDLCRALVALEPFGQGNPEPCFVVRGAHLQDARRVGRDSTHLQARVGSCKLIGFGLGDFAERINEPLDLAVHLGIDTWQGAMRPQMYLQDLRSCVTANIKK